MIPFVINSNICITHEDINTYESFMDSIAGNTGNSYITWALLKEIGCTLDSIKNHQIQSLYTYDFKNADKDIDIINNECTQVILVLQDQIRIHESYGYRLPYAQLKNFLSKVRKPILVAGLGANSLEGFVPDFHKKLDEELISFLHFISEKCNLIGVRGYYTQEVLHNLGINNVTVIGCPSYYETGKNRVITKPEWEKNIRVGISTGVLSPKTAQAIYLQDKSDFEEKVIKAIMLGHRSSFKPQIRKALLLKKYKIYSSIDDWKDDIKNNVDFYVGQRVHGSMVSLNSGVPTIVVNRDSRAREMCEYMNIPYHPELANNGTLYDFWKIADYDKMNIEYNSKLDVYIDFLKKNGVEYNPLDQQSGGVSISLYDNINVYTSFSDQIKSYLDTIDILKRHARRVLPEQVQNVIRSIKHVF